VDLNFIMKKKKCYPVIEYTENKVLSVSEPVYESLRPTLEKMDNFGVQQLEIAEMSIVEPVCKLLDKSKEAVQCIVSPVTETVTSGSQTVKNTVVAPATSIICQTLGTMWSIIKLPARLAFNIIDYSLDRIPSDERAPSPDRKVVNTENLMERFYFLRDTVISKIKTQGYKTEDLVVTVGGIFVDHKMLRLRIEQFNNILEAPFQNLLGALCSGKQKIENENKTDAS